MARNRVIYQSQVVAVSGTDLAFTDNTLKTVQGVQSASYGLDISREDVNQYGKLGAFDRVVLDAPTASMEFSAYAGCLSSTFLNDMVQQAISGKTMHVVVGLDNDEGDDYTTANNQVSLESGAMTSLSAEASVGGIATYSFSFEGTDLTFTDTNTISVPSDNVTTVTQTGVVVGLDTNTSSVYTRAQSANVSFDLGVEGLQQLGNSGNGRFQYARVPTYPANATLNVEALAIDEGVNLTVDNIAAKATTGGGNALKGGFVNVNVNVGGTKFNLVNATLDSVNFTSSIGDNATVDATFTCSIGGLNSRSRFNISS